MKVKQAIQALQNYDPDAEIIIAWWDKEAFPEASQDNWDGSCDWVMDKMDWSGAHEEISCVLRN